MSEFYTNRYEIKMPIPILETKQPLETDTSQMTKICIAFWQFLFLVLLLTLFPVAARLAPNGHMLTDSACFSVLIVSFHFSSFLVQLKARLQDECLKYN